MFCLVAYVRFKSSEETYPMPYAALRRTHLPSSLETLHIYLYKLGFQILYSVSPLKV